jgi:L-2-hydroxyglutarate oxidase LhgO
VPDLNGGFKLGPNAFYVDSIDYTVDKSHAAEFYESAKKYLLFLEPDDLIPDMSGIRPKLSAANEPPRDFYIRHEAERGAAGFINLAGIESPGLTSCCAIGDHVADMVCDVLR